MELKFLQLLKQKKIRPKQLIDVIGNLQPEDGEVACTYLWHDLINNKYYGGMHKDAPKAYWNSSTDEEFQAILINPNSQLTLEILFWGSVQEAYQKEHELLTNANAAASPEWYNKTNGKPGIQPLDYDKVENLRLDIDLIRDNYRKQDKIDNSEFNIINFDALSDEISVVTLNQYKRLQVREDAIDTENLDKIKSSMRVTASIEKYHPPVLLINRMYEGVFYKELVLSGNHTIVAPNELGGAFLQAKYKTIKIEPEVHQNFTDSELFLLGNELNSQKDISSPFKKPDALKECKKLIEKGNTWKSTAQSSRWIRMGLTESNVEWVYKQIRQWLLNKKMEDDGYTIMNYKITHKHVLENKMKLYEDDNTYIVCFSGAALKINNILVPFHKQNKKRKLEGKKLKKRIICFVTFPSEDVQKKEWPKLKKDFEFMEREEKMTRIEYVELPMYTKDII